MQISMMWELKPVISINESQLRYLNLLSQSLGVLYPWGGLYLLSCVKAHSSITFPFYFVRQMNRVTLCQQNIKRRNCAGIFWMAKDTKWVYSLLTMENLPSLSNHLLCC